MLHKSYRLAFVSCGGCLESTKLEIHCQWPTSQNEWICIMCYFFQNSTIPNKNIYEWLNGFQNMEGNFFYLGSCFNSGIMFLSLWYLNSLNHKFALMTVTADSVVLRKCDGCVCSLNSVTSTRLFSYHDQAATKIIFRPFLVTVNHSAAVLVWTASLSETQRQIILLIWRLKVSY